MIEQTDNACSVCFSMPSLYCFIMLKFLNNEFSKENSVTYTQTSLFRNNHN